MADRHWRDKHDVVHVIDPDQLGGQPETSCGERVPGFTAGRFFISEPFLEDEPVTCIACIAKRKYAP